MTLKHLLLSSLMLLSAGTAWADVIIRVRLIADELQLLYIYDKSDYENVSDAFLRDVLKRME